MPVFEYGRWWTVLSAGWLHSGLLHILFNMMWVRQLGPACADLYGAGRMVIIYTVAGRRRLLGQFGRVAVLRRASRFSAAPASPSAPRRRSSGCSARIVLYGQRSGSSMARREGLQYALTIGLFGLIMPGIDNWAHAGGFAGGWLMAKILDPLKPERHRSPRRWPSAACC